MSEKREPGGPPGFFYDDPELIAWGESGAVHPIVKGLVKANLRPPDLPIPFEESLVLERPKTNTAEAIDYILEQLQFESKNSHWVTEVDLLQPEVAEHSHEGVIGSIEHAAHSVSAYLTKVRRHREKGKPEAASFGPGKIDSVKVEIFAMHPDHFGGTIGAIVGEKGKAAIKRARRYNRPLIILSSGGGARQEEGMFALDYLPMLTGPLGKLMEETDVPVLLWSMDSYGGTPASIEGPVLMRGGLAGTKRGFTGERVQEATQGSPLSPGSQTIERAYLRRNIHMLAQGPDELLEWLQRYIKLYKNEPKEKFQMAKVQELPIPQGQVGFHRSIYTGSRLGHNVVEALMPSRQQPLYEIPVPDVNEEAPDGTEADILYRRYMDINTSPSRLDTDTLVRQIFTDVVPYYNYSIEAELDEYEDIETLIKRFPKIICGLGKLGNTTIAFIGNEPSYRLKLRDKRVTIIPPLPDVEDYRYQTDFVHMAERQGYPLFSFINLPGASPTVASEDKGMPVAISMAIEAVTNYEHLTGSVINGAHSSGGASASAPEQDWRAATSRSIFVVADPYAQAAIVEKTNTPTPDMIKKRLVLSRPSAKDQYDFGKVDEVISEYPNPYLTAISIGRAVSRYYETHQHLKGRSLAKHRKSVLEKRVRLPFKEADTSHPEIGF